MTTVRKTKNKSADTKAVHTLALDIGGTGLKASVLDISGNMVADRVRIPTPHPCPPETLVAALKELVKPLPSYDRISVGFPGVIRDGTIITAPNLDTALWHGFPLQNQIAKALGKPARLLNDAEVQGLGLITGHQLEVVITLGTGVGSAIFANGRLTPHLELAHHPIKGDMTYDEYLGEAARKKVGKKKWNKRVLRMIEILSVLTNFDTLHLGGGNAGHVTGPLPKNVRIESNDAGITGGIRLWDDRIWETVGGLA